MARAAKSTSTTKRSTAAPKRRPGRPATKTAKPAAKTTRASAKPGKPAAQAKRAKATPSVAKSVSDDLRALVAKLQRSVTKMQSEHKAMGRAAEEADERIAALEAEVGRLGAAKTTAPKAPRGRRAREIDPGDAVPPGVAVEEPEEPDAEAEAARENLEEHLSGE